MTSTQLNLPISTPKYVPPYRRHNATPSSQQYLNYEDLHARYSPPNSPPLRMPRVQRALSIEDLRQQFQPREQDGSQAQDSPGPPSPPPPLPRDFEALRAHGQRFQSREQDGSRGQNSPQPPPSPPSGSPFGHPRVPPPLQRPFLSPRFPDPPIFNGSDTGILFEDWKLRIRDKLTINKDHYPSEHSQIAYVITRLGGKAIEHTLPRRRTRGPNYHSADEVLSHLGDIYEPTLEVLEAVNRDAFATLEQGDRPFLEFYSDFMKHGPRYYHDRDTSSNEMIAFVLSSKVNYKLRKQLAMHPQKQSLPELRDRLMIVDYLLRSQAATKAKRKVDRVTKQLAMASMESQSKKPGKYAIMPAPDPEEFRR